MDHPAAGAKLRCGHAAGAVGSLLGALVYSARVSSKGNDYGAVVNGHFK